MPSRVQQDQRVAREFRQADGLPRGEPVAARDDDVRRGGRDLPAHDGQALT
jgi:hypothetical protein